MIKKISMLLLVLLYSCGYSSVYKNNGSIDYNIVVTEMTGDITINNLIKNELEIYSNKNSENIYSFKLNTSYSKKIKSKNSSGIASNYELVFSANFNTNSETISFEEKFIVKNMSDSIEQRNYENIIKKNFAALIREKLLIKLLNLK